MLLALGNTAGLVVGLCVIAVWCFLRERFVLAGILCLAVSLAMKPHDAGLIWLYFLLAGGVQRKRALQTLAVTALLAVPAILWISHVAPHWPPELHANLATITARGGLDDPGPSSGGAFGVNMIVCLQAISAASATIPASTIRSPTSSVAALLAHRGAIKTLRSRLLASALAWFALAAVVPLAMLPFYHRCYDARLLCSPFLPAPCSGRKAGPLGWCALAAHSRGHRPHRRHLLDRRLSVHRITRTAPRLWE